ncbi:MAG: uracil-DNA glycosylase [Alphaproteobacteria bacterium]|nr:uracil-DNA glycosylase [Alphaproteobacteria bacterium]
MRRNNPGRLDPTPNRRVNCFNCIHHFITYEKPRPYGCRKFGFKGPRLPSMTVFEVTGTECAYFTRQQFSDTPRQKTTRRRR